MDESGSEQEQNQSAPQLKSSPQRRAGGERPGEGRVVSSWDAKKTLGQGFIRAKHTGQVGPRTSRTEIDATKGMDTGKGPTRIEIEMAQESNPSEWRRLTNEYKQQGLSIAERQTRAYQEMERQGLLD